MKKVRNEIVANGASYDNKWLLTGDAGEDSMIIIWDSKSGMPIKTIFDPHNGIGSCALSMNMPQKLAIWEWTLADNNPLFEVEIETDDFHDCLLFNPDTSFEIVSNGRRSLKCFVWDKATGSAVGAQVVRKLEQKYINIGGVAQLVMDYGGFPLLRPFSSFIGFQSILKNMIHVKFNTEEIIGTLKCPILLIHGQVDAVIPAAQSKNLFMKILNTTDVIKPSKYQEYQYSEGSLFVSLSNQAQYLQLNHASHNDIHEHDITWKIIKNTILQ
ncbi:hypothetical protein O9G_005234 [Rozella allomycis CSF55]|uniref:Uncharacterized protein n=1 Tax=Rozella allomycis (strain CSF55) TaxID=988480 RepID=A0A075AX13_ROZAC|nr:hypothetical protein O9G_005234 [Rozella allomycis CSF55]|eukprot:EPZ34797.1 hypothetical protein O9G_005234 [Rozella allomycis CSF55]